MKLIMRKVGSSLRPVDEEGFNILTKIRNGIPVVTEVWQRRSERQHRMAFGLFKLTFENLPESSHWPTMNHLRKAITIECGYFDEVRDMSSNIQQNAKSLAFDKMDSAEFSMFFEAAIKLVCERIIPGMDDNALKEEILNMVS